jgi:hypothetical protein
MKTIHLRDDSPRDLQLPRSLNTSLSHTRTLLVRSHEGINIATMTPSLFSNGHPEVAGTSSNMTLNMSQKCLRAQ